MLRARIAHQTRAAHALLAAKGRLIATAETVALGDCSAHWQHVPMYKQMSANNPAPLQGCDRMANGRGFFPRHAPRAKEGCRMLDPIEAGAHAEKRLPQGGCPDPVLPMSTSRSAGRNVSLDDELCDAPLRRWANSTSTAAYIPRAMPVSLEMHADT
jgi:hypothetical protein